MGFFPQRKEIRKGAANESFALFIKYAKVWIWPGRFLNKILMQISYHLFGWTRRWKIGTYQSVRAFWILWSLVFITATFFFHSFTGKLLTLLERKCWYRFLLKQKIITKLKNKSKAACYKQKTHSKKAASIYHFIPSNNSTWSNEPVFPLKHHLSKKFTHLIWLKQNEHNLNKFETSKKCVYRKKNSNSLPIYNRVHLMGDRKVKFR